MKNILLLFIVATTFTFCGNNSEKQQAKDEATATSTYYFIRHSEKDRSDKSNANPSLNADGEARAQYWATYFKDIALDAVYATNYNRTQQTATPTAQSKNLDVITYEATDMFTEDFKNATKNKTVLVVGHSNTVPAFVNSIVGENSYNDIDDNENGMLYTVHLQNGETTVDIKKIDVPQ